MSQRVLVTGGLGFVGSALVARLVERGHEVTVFDNLSRGQADNVELDRVVLIEGDLRDPAAVVAAVASAPFDAVLHLAAMHFLPDCNRDPQGCIDVNVIGTENLLQACDAHRIGTVVAFSSMAVYPASDVATSEDDPVGPYDIYGETKVANELQLRRWSRADPGRVAVAIRLSNAYGPRETNPHVIPVIMEQLRAGVTELDLGATSPLRDYVHTTDIAEGLGELLEAGLAPGYHVFNLGSGTERSVDSIIAALGIITGRELTTRFNPEKLRSIERMHLLPEIRRIEAETGWTPRIDFDDGLRDLVEWYGVPTAVVRP